MSLLVYKAELCHDTRIARKPLTAEKINFETQKLSPGDHILYRLRRKKCYRASYRSAIVTYTDEQYISVIENTENGVQENKIFPKSNDEIYTVVYTSSGKYSPEQAVERAKTRIGEMRYHVLFNNSHFFVTLAKTGRELLMSDVFISMKEEQLFTKCQTDDKMVPALFTKNILSINDLNPADHIVLHNEHWLVEEVNKNHNTVIAYSWVKGNIIKSELKFECHLAFVVKYDPVAANLRDAQTVFTEAQELFAASEKKFSSSDEFVTAMITGKKQSTGCNFESIISCNDLKPGDHVVQHVKQLWVYVEHWLVEEVNQKENNFSAYGWKKGNIIKKNKLTFDCKAVFVVKYDPVAANLRDGKTVIKEAQELLAAQETKFSSSDEFVTAMITGKKWSFQRIGCIFENEYPEHNLTKVTPDVSIDEGDHLALIIDTCECHILVHSVLDSQTLLIAPPISCAEERSPVYEVQNSKLQRVTIEDLEVYRINYEHCLPPDQTIDRALSKPGVEFLQKHTQCKFVSWAKTGSPVNINLAELKTKQQVIIQKQPIMYERIISVDEIKEGDHLIESTPFYWFHYMVTEKHDKGFSIIYQLRAQIKERGYAINPKEQKLYRIIYPDSLPAEVAIKNARTKLCRRDFSIHGRLNFIRWAKTGSTDGIEVQYLINNSKPTSKSTIVSFAQLEPGDYLVYKEDGNTSAYHHCLVKEVMSPMRCCVLEVWYKCFKEHSLNINLLKGHKFYRINYNDRACIQTSQTLEMAKKMIQKDNKEKKKNIRRRFVQYVKTLDDSEISVNDLQDDRILLPRKRVHSVRELMLGDHLEHDGKLSSKYFEYQHHMLVTQQESGKPCIITERNGKSGRIQETELVSDGDLNEKEVCRILYPETIDPEIGLANIQDQKENESRYHPFNNNCEHLAMLGTVGESVSIQVNEIHRKALIATAQSPIVLTKSFSHTAGKASLKSLAKTTAKLSTRTGARLAVRGAAKGTALEATGTKVSEVAAFSSFQLGYRAALSGTAVGTVAGVAIGVNLLVEAPLLGYSIYKLFRKKKFNQISQVDFDKEVVKSTTKSANAAVGAVGGALVGQVAIPVPVLGAAVGGAVGSVVGQLCGIAEGELFSRAVPDKKNTLPFIVVNKFTDIQSDSEYSIKLEECVVHFDKN